jgi:hypothetical protein
MPEEGRTRMKDRSHQGRSIMGEGGKRNKEGEYG